MNIIFFHSLKWEANLEHDLCRSFAMSNNIMPETKNPISLDQAT